MLAKGMNPDAPSCVLGMIVWKMFRIANSQTRPKRSAAGSIVGRDLGRSARRGKTLAADPATSALGNSALPTPRRVPTLLAHEIQKADAVRFYGPHAVWKDVGQRVLDQTCTIAQAGTRKMDAGRIGSVKAH